MKLIIYRDDYSYPIYASSFAEMREKRNEGNRRFISHYYGSVCKDCTTEKYYNIITETEVSASEKEW